jgi:hypothetical protein
MLYHESYNTIHENRDSKLDYFPYFYSIMSYRFIFWEIQLTQKRVIVFHQELLD